MFGQIQSDLKSINLLVSEEDKWVWEKETTNLYYVKFAYMVLCLCKEWIHKSSS